MKSLKVLAVLMAGVVMGVVSGMGQVTAGSTATFQVPTLIRLQLNLSLIDFGELTLDDYDVGYKDYIGTAQIVSVWSNRTWTLSVAANSATWTGPWAKPASDLLLRVASVNSGRITWHRTTLTGLTTAGFIIATGLPGGNLQHTMDFRVLVSWDDDVAGDYSLEFTYTLTAP